MPKLLRYYSHRFGSTKVALREKTMGVWKPYSWMEYCSIVEKLSLAFQQMGLEEGAKVAILGENKPHVYWFELAAQTNRAVVVGIFSDCVVSEVEYFVNHAECSFVVCQDQEQVDKLLEIKEKIPKVKKVIYWDKKGMWSYDDPILITFEEMLVSGKKISEQDPDLFNEMVEKTKGEDIAIYFFTSGTTGLPKAAMVSHQTIIGMADLMKRGIVYNEDDNTVSYVPIAWIGEQMFNVVCSLLYGFTVNFPESQETVVQNIREIGPTVLFLGPRQWEEHIRSIRVRMLDALWINQLFYNVLLKVGYHVAIPKMTGKETGIGWKILNYIADKTVFKPLRDKLGMSNLRWAFTAGSAVSPDVLRYFHAIGVSLTQMYGSSEIGCASIHLRNDIKPETCGKPLDGYHVEISRQGEILIKSPHLFQGYFNNPKKTENAFIDGWYRTGDFGRLDDDGHLIVMDRMDDIRYLSGNKSFSPQFAETRMRFSSYLKDAFIAGDSSYDHVVALINIDYDNVGKWADRRRITYTSYSDLSQKHEVLKLVREQIRDINNMLSEHAKIRTFISLPKQFDPDEAELTRTRKIRRDFLEDKYRNLLDAMYRGKDATDFELSVDYRDGTKNKLALTVSINQV